MKYSYLCIDKIYAILLCEVNDDEGISKYKCAFKNTVLR